MANEIRVNTSVELVNDNSVSNEGGAAGDYNNKNLEVFADSRPWGGKYTMSTAYSHDDVGYWTNVQVEASSAQAVNGSSVFYADPAITGTMPTNVFLVAVEVTRTRGDVTDVYVTISGEIFAALKVGEGIVIPMHAGEAVSSVKLHTNGTFNAANSFARANVLIAGT